jgi:hypothetical protein
VKKNYIPVISLTDILLSGCMKEPVKVAFVGDSIHPNETAARKMAEIIADEIIEHK